MSEEIGDALENLDGPAGFQIDVVRSSDPDEVFPVCPELMLYEVDFDRTAVRGSLTISDPRVKSWPTDIYSPTDFEGMF